MARPFGRAWAPPVFTVAKLKLADFIKDKARKKRLVGAPTSFAEARKLYKQDLADDRKSCPKCQSEMVLRVATKGSKVGQKFWGCSALPKCRFTLEA